MMVEYNPHEHLHVTRLTHFLAYPGAFTTVHTDLHSFITQPCVRNQYPYLARHSLASNNAMVLPLPPDSAPEQTMEKHTNLSSPFPFQFLYICTVHLSLFPVSSPILYDLFSTHPSIPARTYSSALEVVMQPGHGPFKCAVRAQNPIGSGSCATQRHRQILE